MNHPHILTVYDVGALRIRPGPKIVHRTYSVSLQPGEDIAALPRGGVDLDNVQKSVPEAGSLPQEREFFAVDPSVYAYLTISTHRNIYRIPTP